MDLRANQHGLERELFGVFRANAAGAERGAMTFAALEVAETGKSGD